MTKKKLIVLSYAHYPKKGGASFNGVNEHILSIEWTNLLQEILVKKGYEVKITPIGGLTNKVNFINALRPDIAVEIHFNGSSNPKVSGVETLYCPDSKKGAQLARTVHMHYATTMMCRDRGIKEGWYRMDRPYIEDYPGDVDGDEVADYFLKKTCCPAIIPEPEFMSQLNSIKARRSVAVMSIANGIDAYLGG